MWPRKVDPRDEKCTSDSFVGCVEESHELERGNPVREFKGGVVVLENHVVRQSLEAVVLQDSGNALATVEASRVAGRVGRASRKSVPVAEAVQVDQQADLKGPTCCAVIRPVEAHYGYPDSRAHWENIAMKRSARLD